ncbi:MAG: RNA 2',3'-cyclic phosphodiesterase [Candidatus Aenigmarchaeota archaeon]|nr:RNA 2',3'-cyclic phosphodiesterase [Candidatus Aenigmarchaeota archaeon]
MQNRCFLAIDVNDHVKVNVKVTQGHVKESEADVKLVDAKNLHFTVRFLGNLSDGQVKLVIDTLEPLLSRELSSKVSVQGLGFFGPMKEPRVIWAGVTAGKLYLEGLFTRVSDAVREILPENDERDVIPHLTIARIRSVKNINMLRQTIVKESETFFGEILIDAVKLKSSTLTPQGSRYTDVAVFPLCDMNSS